MNNSKKIFITGGSGFIGYYLQQYIDKETTIYGLAEPELKLPAASCGESSTVRKFAIFRFARQPRSKLRGMRSLLRFRHSASYVKGDVRDRETLTKALNGHDIVFHLAAKHHDFGVSRSEYMDTNEGGAKALVEAARDTGVKKIVFLSSVLYMGIETSPPPKRHLLNQPIHMANQSLLLNECF